MRTVLNAFVLIFAVTSVAKGGPLPVFWSVSAYNGYSVTFSCYEKYVCRPDASESRLIQTEAQRICGRKKVAELAGAWEQYGASNMLYLCLDF